MINWPGWRGTNPVLALNVLCPGKPLSPRPKLAILEPGEIEILNRETPYSNGYFQEKTWPVQANWKPDFQAAAGKVRMLGIQCL